MALLSLVFAATACSSSPETELLESKPDFIGFITAIEPRQTGDGPAHLTVESHADKLVRRLLVRLDSGSAVYRRADKTVQPAERRALQLKGWVEIWFRGSDKTATEVIARQVVMTDRP